MASDVVTGSSAKTMTFPFHRTVPRFLRDPLKSFEEIGRRSGGQVARINLGMFRPYLVTHPDHVQYVLSDNAANYRREGLLWKPLSRLVGEPSGADPSWWMKRSAFQSLVSGPNIASFTNDMAAAIVDAVDDLAGRAGDGRPVDATAEMTRIVYRAITKIFVGDKVSMNQADELGRAIMTATGSSFRARMLFPFVPFAIPLPGDRAFNDAVRVVDDLILPIVRESRSREAEGTDVVSRLIREQDAEGRRLSEQEIRDGIVSLFVAGTETTVTALTFLWMVLDSHPEVAAKLYAEIDEVVGTDRPTSAHLPGLRYTKMVSQELLRVFPPGWILPRIVAEDDVIDGVRIERGAIMVVSPYLTHRLEEVWERPEVFDPERWRSSRARHRFAYLTFGGGPHQCVGRLFFTVEAQLILAALLSRFRPVLQGSPPLEPQLGLTLKPQERIIISLQRVER
jgi:cytochrome P450